MINPVDPAPAKVILFIHHSPFDGCFWRQELIAFEDEGNIVPIVFTPSRVKAEDIVLAARAGQEKIPGSKIEDIMVFDWDDDLYKAIHPTHWNALWFASYENNSLPQFQWQCNICGAIIDEEPPQYSLDTRGIGGIGVQTDSWVCLSCAGYPRFGEYGYTLKVKPHD